MTNNHDHTLSTPQPFNEDWRQWYNKCAVHLCKDEAKTRLNAFIGHRLSKLLEAKKSRYPQLGPELARLAELDEAAAGWFDKYFWMTPRPQMVVADPTKPVRKEAFYRKFRSNWDGEPVNADKSPMCGSMAKACLAVADLVVRDLVGKNPLEGIGGNNGNDEPIVTKVEALLDPKGVDDWLSVMPEDRKPFLVLWTLAKVDGATRCFPLEWLDRQGVSQATAYRREAELQANLESILSGMGKMEQQDFLRSLLLWAEQQEGSPKGEPS